ncbi:hypothetical protein B9Z55_000775 [Caenorhabditis nigoni]|nr:hypothetical protein B9Z55_000606 [Caenorhabditis nigoni]PIC55548.1 hypothetical protein B9Z55_000775 [Caenorhabditis nigoni]
MLTAHGLSYQDLCKIRNSQDCKNDIVMTTTNTSMRNAQAMFFATCNIPFRVVESPSYREYITMLRPDFPLTNANAVRDDIYKMNNTYRAQISEKIGNRKDLCLITDGWSSSKAEFTLYAILAGYMDNRGLMLQQLVGVFDVKSSAAVDLHQDFITELKSSGLSLNQFGSMVSDGASNLKALADRLKIPKLHCCSHILHLVVSEAITLKPIHSIIEKAKLIARKLNKSGTLRIQIRKLAQFSNNSSALPQSYSKTRWNGVVDLLMTTKNHIGSLASSPDFSSMLFTGNELRLMEVVIQLLEPVKITSTRFEARSSQASESYPYLKFLKHQLTELLDTILKDPENKSIVEQAKSFGCKLLKCLDNRIASVGENSIVPQLMLIDPRFSYSSLLTDEQWKGAEEKLLAEYDDSTVAGPLLLPVSSKSKSCSMDVFLSSGQQSVSNNGSQKSKATKEIEAYRNQIKESRLSSTSDPMAFWSTNEAKYPILSQSAHKFLAIPASSASSERLFSSCGRILANRLRNRMQPETCSALLLVQAKSGMEKLEAWRENPSADQEYEGDALDDEEDDEHIYSDQSDDEINPIGGSGDC